MPGIDLIFSDSNCLLEIYLEFMEVIFKSGSIAWYKSATTEVKPFIADSIITKAAVVTAMATILIHEITFIALVDFLEIK